MTTISEAEFAKICRGIYDDQDSIVRYNPIGSRPDILLWMLLSCLVTYLSLSETETPCFPGSPNADTYREAIHYILQRRCAAPFDADVYMDRLISE